MFREFLRKNKFFRKSIYKVARARAIDIVNKIESFLKRDSLILDIGSGTCNVCEVLQSKGFRVVPLDVQNLSFVDNIRPIIYDGNKMPFKDNEFDVSLISCVLHHTSKPDDILREAKRVSNSIIIIEDIHSNLLHKYVNCFFDSLLNLEFIGHPHSNRSDKEWRRAFQNFGLKVIDARYGRSFIVFKHAVYYLKK